MIQHAIKTEPLECEPVDGRFPALDKTLLIALLEKHALAPVAAGDHVVDCAREFNA